MEKGNLWQYWSPETHSTMSIAISGDTIVQNGKTYTKIDMYYLRKEGNKVFEYSYPSERLIYDFSKKAGDTLTSQNNSKIIVLDTGSMFIFGSDRRYWKFILNPFWIKTIVDSLGVDVFVEFPGALFGLTGAIINGKTYGTITSVADSKISSIVNNYSLTQNYPNPFNPTTTVRYSIPFTSFVSLKIFNTLGQEVDVLMNEEKLAGNYSVRWNALNLSSGLYFYRLQSGNYSETKKMILTK